jgi:phosphofructokinase-like protein
MKRRIGVLTSGGDCPGLNAVLHGIVRAAAALDWEVIGFRDGFEGILPPPRVMPLTRANTAGIMHLGGTILGTTNRGHFMKRSTGLERSRVRTEVVGKARQALEKLGITALIVIGGDGSMSTAAQLSEAGFPIIGVPKTIDNDLDATSMTFGFDSAVACVADALDRLHTTATSHKRVMVLEVMGRKAGWIALYGGLAGGGDIILIPEIPFDPRRIADTVRRRDDQGCPSTMVVVAEGARPREGRRQLHQRERGEFRFGGIGEFVANEIHHRTRKETRTCVLGHLQRGGQPTILDRILGTRFGVKAVELVKRGAFGMMVSFQNYEVTHVPISEAINRLRLVPPDHELVSTARAVNIAFGD